LVALALKPIGIVGGVVYADAADGARLKSPDTPVLGHLVGCRTAEGKKHDGVSEYFYVKADSSPFATPFEKDSDYM
jgi:hypothetical protein